MNFVHDPAQSRPFTVFRAGLIVISSYPALGGIGDEEAYPRPRVRFDVRGGHPRRADAHRLGLQVQRGQRHRRAGSHEGERRGFHEGPPGSHDRPRRPTDRQHAVLPNHPERGHRGLRPRRRDVPSGRTRGRLRRHPRRPRSLHQGRERPVHHGQHRDVLPEREAGQPGQGPPADHAGLRLLLQ